MKAVPAQITLEEWGTHYGNLQAAGFQEPFYGGPLQRHVTEGDYRLRKLLFDNSPASLRLWNFLLTESSRLYRAQREGKTIIGTMKDLGTIPVMAYSLPNTVAFYPDGAWWVPCIMEQTTADLAIADSLGIDESFCPVRAMLGAFETNQHFPNPDLLICSVGATCDDFSAIAQRLEAMGRPIFWWEIVPRHPAEDPCRNIILPGGFPADPSQVAFIKSELERIQHALENVTRQQLSDERMSEGIRMANQVRRILQELRTLVFTAAKSPLPALEMLIAEMLAIHYCSDRNETIAVLRDLLEEVKARIGRNEGLLHEDAARIFWVNPVADLRAMNLLEQAGGRLCGTEFLFCHALDEIPEDLPPLESLARMALADPMVGPSGDRAERILRDAVAWGAEAVLVSRIPGASHCSHEGLVITEKVRNTLRLPVLEIEVPPLCDGLEPAIGNRLEALAEIVKERRARC